MTAALDHRWSAASNATGEVHRQILPGRVSHRLERQFALAAVDGCYHFAFREII
jgi:hypothetical protein